MRRFPRPQCFRRWTLKKSHGSNVMRARYRKPRRLPPEARLYRARLWTVIQTVTRFRKPNFTRWGLYREDSHQSNPTNFSSQHTVISVSAGVLHISQLATAQPSQCSQWLWSRAESRQVLPRIKDKATSQDSTVWSGHWSRAKRTSPKCPYLFWESALIPLGFFAFLLVFCSMDFLLFPLPGVTVIITVKANMYSVLPLCEALS